MTLHYDKDAGAGYVYACNMRWVVLAGEREVYRGPYWRAKMISHGTRGR